MTKNPVNHGRAKHIDIKYHHIRDEIKRSELYLESYETSNMLANIMTKRLPEPRHKDMTATFGLQRVRIEEVSSTFNANCIFRFPDCKRRQ